MIYYPTPDETVTEMLRLANIRQGDVLYDLGSSEGRIPIMAAGILAHPRHLSEDRCEKEASAATGADASNFNDTVH